MSESGARAVATMFERMAEAIEAEKDHLSELDGAIGDGDHGITMSIGFKAANAALAQLDLDAASSSDVMSTAATAFLDAVGASTGPLYATAAADNGAAATATMIATKGRAARLRERSLGHLDPGAVSAAALVRAMAAAL